MARRLLGVAAALVPKCEFSFMLRIFLHAASAPGLRLVYTLPVLRNQRYIALHRPRDLCLHLCIVSDLCP
jgi:hypothetical protein